MTRNLRIVGKLISMTAGYVRYKNKIISMRFTNIQSKIDLIREFISDASFNEGEYEKFIIKLGLNNEILREFPEHLHKQAGRGLFIWQYPNQFSKYLEFLRLSDFKIDNYLEIGSRFGGTLILTSIFLETLFHKDLYNVIAVDPIKISPLLKKFRQNSSNFFYIQGFSDRLNTKNVIHNLNLRNTLSFIDGNHSYKSVLNDFYLVKEFSSVIVFHDISSDACPDVLRAYEYIKSIYNYRSIEFVDQYDSVNGKYLGMGVLF